MTVHEWLRHIQEFHEVRFGVRDDELVIYDPTDFFTDDDLARIREHAPEVLDAIALDRDPRLRVGAALSLSPEAYRRFQVMVRQVPASPRTIPYLVADPVLAGHCGSCGDLWPAGTGWCRYCPPCREAAQAAIMAVREGIIVEEEK